MLLKKYTILSVMLAVCGLLNAQQPLVNWCGVSDKSPWLEWYQHHKNAIATDRGVDTSWLYVPVTIQLVGDDDGNGYFPIDYAIRAVCGMNERFVGARIRYYLQPNDAFRYINNSDWYNHQWDGGKDLILENNIPDRLNAYVVENPAGNCGYAWFDAIVLKKDCSGPDNTTWSHEAGHHFSLPHPFLGWENRTWDFSEPAPEKWGNRLVEKLDGSNCDVAGDGFCDTRPDYLSDRWNCNPDKESYVQQHDPNGAAFRSDATLLMGYASDACSSRFTEEQIAAMRANLYDQHASYLQIFEPLPGIPDDAIVELTSPIDSEAVQYNNVPLSWKPVPNATYYKVQVALFSNFSPIIFSTMVHKSTSLLIDKALPVNRKLYWRVTAFNEWEVCGGNNGAQTGIFKTQNFTATNELERVAAINLMPNPISGGQAAHLLVASSDAMDARLHVTDAAGRLCFQQNIRVLSGDNTIEIPTAGLQAGLYLVTFQNEKGAAVKRLVVAE